jgi:Ca2+-binding EF-hand superfamily protein
MDTHSENRLTPQDIKKALNSCGYSPTIKYIYQMISELDVDDSGGIDFREFLTVVTTR